MALYSHECFIPPADNTVLWRYMSIEKYESFLKERALFFCRLDRFKDVFEGSIPKIEADYRFLGAKEVARRAGREFDEREEMERDRAMGELHQRIRKGTTVSCWHDNQFESTALWSEYAGESGGVAIQTTIGRVNKIINSLPEKLGISKVRYLNYDTDGWYHPVECPETGYNLFIPIVHKRREFIHENEVRLIHHSQEAVDKDNYWDCQPNENGEFIRMNIDDLVEKVILAPTMGADAAETIRKLTEKYGLAFHFKKSALSTQPRF